MKRTVQRIVEARTYKILMLLKYAFSCLHHRTVGMWNIHTLFLRHCLLSVSKQLVNVQSPNEGSRWFGKGSSKGDEDWTHILKVSLTDHIKRNGKPFLLWQFDNLTVETKQIFFYLRLKTFQMYSFLYSSQAIWHLLSFMETIIAEVWVYNSTLFA